MFSPSQFFPLGTMASADFLQFVVTTIFFFLVCKTSSGKCYNFHLIYLLHLHLEIRAVLDFILYRKLVRFKMPYMQFLFVRPRFCFRLPSDSASQRTPLPLANSSYCQVCSGLSPPSNNACRAHYKINKAIQTNDLVLILSVFIFKNVFARRNDKSLRAFRAFALCNKSCL